MKLDYQYVINKEQNIDYNLNYVAKYKVCVGGFEFDTHREHPQGGTKGFKCN